MYLKQLREALENFDPVKAEALSLQLHEAEARGEDLSPWEESLWEQLTDRLLAHN